MVVCSSSSTCRISLWTIVDTRSSLFFYYLLFIYLIVVKCLFLLLLLFINLLLCLKKTQLESPSARSTLFSAVLAAEVGGVPVLRWLLAHHLNK